MKIAWLAYGTLEERTGGTIYDRIVVAGLPNVSVHSVRRGDPASLVRDLARTRPDVIVGDELCHPELAYVFPRVPFAKRVLLVHHLTCWEKELPAPVRLRAECMERTALRHADRIIATSQATRTRLGCEATVVLPGADRLRLGELAPRSGRFLFVGALIPRKGVHRIVLSRSTGLVLVGRTPDAAYRRRVEVLPGFEVRGEVDDDTLRRELLAADALVMPSSLEGYGIAVTEAAYLGVPVIAAHGMEEALAPAGDGAAFTDDFTNLGRFDLPRMRSVLAQTSRTRWPTWAATVRAFEEALRAPAPRSAPAPFARRPSSLLRRTRSPSRIARQP